MPASTAQPAEVAPLQRVMLGDSLAAPASGHHVEQLEIRFSTATDADRLAAAWAATVARTAALRTGFLVENGKLTGLVPAEAWETLEIKGSEPESIVAWAEEDRRRPLLAPGGVPWRAVYWPGKRRFVWTFHHALLDGRSIARISAGFLARISGRPAPPLALAKWLPPSPAIVREAAPIFAELAEIVPVLPVATPECPGPAISEMGADFVTRLETAAAKAEVTAAAVVTWAWGQTVARAADTERVLVEQVRCGPPLPETAGFTMNTLPIAIFRGDSTWENVRELRSRLLEMRRFEAVSAGDFPYGGFPDMSAPAISVIMVERGSLARQIGEGTLGAAGVEELLLHEADGQSLMATAHLAPALRLAVEGPGKHALLGAWTVVLREIVNP